MRPRTWWIGLGGLAALWLVPASFVSIYRPDGDPRADPLEMADARRAEGLRPAWLMELGYVRSHTTQTWVGQEESPPDADTTTLLVARGPVDRSLGTFRLGVRYSRRPADGIESVRLAVTTDGEGTEATGSAWRQVAETTAADVENSTTTFELRADVPADATALRIEEVRDGQAVPVRSETMPKADTWMGRVYDEVAWRPMFSWLPALR